MRSLLQLKWQAVFLVSVLCMSPQGSQAQTSAGAILGVVTDQTGAAVPDAHVVVRNIGTNAELHFDTGANGNYSFSSLIPGEYLVEVSKTGFETVGAPHVRVDVNQSVRIDLKLPLGQTTQEIQVQATPTLVQTDNVTVGQVIDNRQVTDLPLSGRDFTNLVRLGANVTQVSGGINAATNIRRHGLDDTFSNVSVNGSRPAAISFLIDGVTDNEGLFQTAAVIPPIDAIEEFKLQTSQYSAEFGMGAGQVNVALKAGTNTLHGALWEFIRNDALQPRNPRTHIVTPLKQNQFGFAVGGPVLIPKVFNGKNRTFFFVSYEGGRRTSASVGRGQVPTAQELQGNFSDWPTQLYNPLTTVPSPGSPGNISRSPFPGNQIPLSLLAPQSLAIAKYFPAPNVACTLPCNNFVRTYSGTIDTDTVTSRFDHYISQSDRIFGQYLQEVQAAGAPNLIPLSGTTGIQRTHLASIQWAHIFSPRMLNEFRVGYNNLYFLNSYETSNGSVKYWQQVGLQNLVPGPLYNALPNIVLGSSYAPLGASGAVPFLNISNTFQFSEPSASRDPVTICGSALMCGRTSTTIRAGTAALDRCTSPDNTPHKILCCPKPRASRRRVMALPISCWATPMRWGPSAVAFRSFESGVDRGRYTDIGLYLQDDFRISSQLTLNLGTSVGVPHAPI